MNLLDVFEQLSTGEFSQISLGGQETGVINEHNGAKVINHINLGLASLFRRFHLREGQAYVDLVPGIYDYTLDEPDLLKIERIYSDQGREYVLNDLGDALSIRTLGMQHILVPEKIVDLSQDIPQEYQAHTLQIAYRANHPKIPNLYADGDIPSEEDVAAVDVELSPAYLEALLYFVAARVQTPIGLMNEFNASNNYMQKYEMLCQQLEQNNLQRDLGSSDLLRFHQRGFV